ncbi:UDP-glucose 4-epimerase GalE [Cyanobacterium sp. uoEpiScrs1]|uniref:UDP-glucose 4-epimerase GalE n=1 Tax=Cyanobacterium sp. uoEpiScrs1 TaxID=2976343 RepID=UPI00226AC725|nr:UDP-glucose 4-epimerase GalE [Cyanobacterium sp. uoEpiScrs1]
MDTKSTILVTGGAGYIGSHAVLALQESGYNVIILDNLSEGHPDLVKDVLQVELIVGDTNDRLILDEIFARHDIAAVMHFAAYVAVGESVTNPDRYYRNNVVGTLTLLEAMIAANVKKFVFSSTCAIYGISQQIPMMENYPQDPLSPYAVSKAMIERILQDFDKAYNLRYVAFRYFNASGANPQGRLGEDHHPETHLIPLALLTALKIQKSLSIFGVDYDTPDGTAIRDYIHVDDLASAHVLGLGYLLDGGKSDVFNLGNGNGFSVHEVIETVKKVTQIDFPVQERDRRPGDPPILVGSSQKARNTLGWKPKYSDLETIVNHAWYWHQKRHGNMDK